jgi:large subunit ribosomal protein L15
MNLSDLKPAPGSVQRRKKIGRGVGSGHGKTSTRGHKGDKARGQSKLGFEGGQTPLHRRLPKQRGLGTGLTSRGFNNGRYKTHYHIVNLSQLEQFEDGTEITPEFLAENKVIKDTTLGVKVLANGEFTKKLTIKAQKFSGNAETVITEKGGTAEVI